MKRKVLFAFGLTLLLSFTSFGASYFTGSLTNTQEVPPTTSTATGFGRVTLNDAEDQITVSIYWSGLTGNATAGHIHGPAPAGSNAGVLFNLAPAASTSGSVVAATFAVTPTQVSQVKAGLWYFNIHTAMFVNGEIRGQIGVDSPYVAYMDNNQENPATTSTARGAGVVSINAAGTQALVSMSWTGLSGNATSGHVHTGRSGVNGGIVCDLTPGATTSGSVTDRLCNFTGPQITLLRQGQFYLNVHTAANATGEIRGQIQRRRSTVLDFDGDGITDLTNVRNNTGANQIEWWTLNSSTGTASAFAMGVSAEFVTSRFASCDYDGDGKDDASVWRSAAAPGAGFLIAQSSNFTLRFEQFGVTGDDPRVAYDYDGDGRCDPAVFRTSDDTWYYLGSSNNAARAISGIRWGASFANPGDYDGDGRGDFMNQSGGNWWILNSRDFSIRVVTIGTGGSFGVPGDYDGDGKTDVAITSTESSQFAWYYVSTLTPGQDIFLTRRAWGASTSVNRAQGDYDGDGRTDRAVYLQTPDQYWALLANDTHTAWQWGAGTDFPLAGYNNR